MLKHIISISTMIIGLLLNLACGGEDITIQGTELINTVIAELNAVSIHAGQEDIEPDLFYLEKADQIWQSFVDHHTKTYMNEVTASKEIQGIIDTVTAALDEIIQKRNQESVDKILAELPSLVQSLEKLLKYCDIPVLLDFTGAVCKSCKVMKERLESVAIDVAGTARIAIIDVNNQKDLCRKYKIMLVPTLVFIDHSGKEAKRYVGEMEEYAVKTTLKQLLKK